MRFFIPRFVGTIVFILVLCVIGVVGYMMIEGWNFADALYMTVITLTAVGYQEVQPLSPLGRVFTMGLLAGGITWLGVWFAVVTSFIIELDLKNFFRSRYTMKQVAELEGHVIICGAGRTGSQVMEEFILFGQSFVIIERDEDALQKLRDSDSEILTLHGDATDDHLLETAGIKRASGLVAALSADTDNLFVCLSARDLNPNLSIVARAYDESTIPKLYRAGADHVISPNVSGAIRMASVILRPSVVSFLDVATRSAGLALRLEQASIEGGSRLDGKTLQEAKIPQETGLLVIAVKKAGGTEDAPFLFNPGGETTLSSGDEMIVLGKPDQVRALRHYVGS